MGIYVKQFGSYPATVRRTGNSFEARFVDLPNCVANGSSALEAEKSAHAALTAYADASRRHARTMPAPSLVKDASNVRDNYVAYIKLLTTDEAPLIKSISENNSDRSLLS